MSENTAIGGIGVASSGVNTSYASVGNNDEGKQTKKVAYTNSIFQGIIPPNTSDASAIRA